MQFRLFYSYLGDYRSALIPGNGTPTSRLFKILMSMCIRYNFFQKLWLAVLCCCWLLLLQWNRSVSYHLVWKISDLRARLDCCWEVLNCEGKSWLSRTAKGSARSSSPCFAKNLPFSSPQATRKKSIVLSKILQFYTHYLLNAVQNQLNSKRTLYASY